jgi:hypothetical protein
VNNKDLISGKLYGNFPYFSESYWLSSTKLRTYFGYLTVTSGICREPQRSLDCGSPFCIFCYHRANWRSSATLTEVFRAFSSVVRQMPGVYLAKMEHGPHSSQLVNCVVICIVCVDCVVLCIVCVYMYTVLLPPGVNPIAFDKYIISTLLRYVRYIACRVAY